MYERCPVCGWRFEREEALATSQIPVLLLMIVSLPLPILLPLLFFRHAKSLWMSFDFMIHPVEPDERRGPIPLP